MSRYIPRKTAIALFAAALGCAAGAAGAAEPDAVARGRYIAAAAACELCHTAGGGRPYAGGLALELPYGILVPPNITPDPETGIGKWSLADFTRALRWGIAPDDSHYLPIFPFPFYNRLSDRDVADLKAFLDTLPAVSQPNRGFSGSDFSAVRARAAIEVAVEALPGPWQPDPAHDAEWNRGAYLVAAVGHCGDCHTPHNWLGVRDPARFLAGATGTPFAKRVPNITPDPDSGIGNWSTEDIAAVLKDGRTPDFDFVGGAMGEIVKATSRLDDADRHAIAVYLKTVPAVSGQKMTRR